jgi:membrane associated rhomboid family serine protease
MAKITNEKKTETRETLTRRYPVLGLPTGVLWVLRIFLAIGVFLLAIFWGLWVVIALVNLVVRGFMTYFQLNGDVDQNVVFWISRILGLIPGVLFAWIVDREVFAKPLAKLHGLLGDKNE